MVLVENLVLILHFIGLASVIGGFLVQISSSPRVVNNAMFHGIITQLVTGVLLVGLAYPIHAQDPAEPLPDNAKVTVKFLIALVILVLVLVNRKKPAISNAVWGAIGGLAILNVAIAVLW